ncbi:putative F-box protein At1g58310 [Medicago truncatula]|nr:putative F-box protein At1g58310 [Medicago truncatula]
MNKSNCIERLTVQIYRATVDTDRVSSRIASAVKHKVQNLNLTLGHENNKFMLPHSFSAFESLNELCLGLMFTLHIPSELEWYNCYWENIKQISVAISTLRKLRIKFEHFSVRYDHDMKLQIDAVNLLSLSCRCNPTIEFIPVNLTSVVDASIDLGGLFPPYDLYAAQCVVELLSGLSNVKSLKLSAATLQCFYPRKDTLNLLSTFYNLTHLGVFSSHPENTSEVLMDILRKTPKLEVLEIPGVVHNYLGGEDLMLNSVPCCFKSSLNRLCIFNFYGDEYEIKFLTFMLKNCQYLGDIKIHSSRHLTADAEKLDDVRNQLEDLGPESCVI